jgi:hypothetical protein
MLMPLWTWFENQILFFSHSFQGPVASERAIHKKYDNQYASIGLGQDIGPEGGEPKKESQTKKERNHC